MLEKLQKLLQRLSVVEKTTNEEELALMCEQTIDFDGTHEFSFTPLDSMDFSSSFPSVEERDRVDPQLQQDQRYTVHRLLGKGGMAKVWEVQDSELLRVVALKILHSDRRVDPYEQENFVIEAQLTSQLQHPGIVPIYELKSLKDDAIYFTMREIKGEVFRQKIRDVHSASNQAEWKMASDGWNLRRLVEVIRDICQTLSYAHSRGVIHRDIKPSNIMIGEYGEVLLVDWGIAKLVSLGREVSEEEDLVQIQASPAFIERRKSSIAGTPSYMAPEQINGSYDQLDVQADIYSVGVMLYEILVGKKPFSGSIEHIFTLKIDQESPSIFDYMKDLEAEGIEYRPIPEELAQICQRCMQKNPSERYHSARDLMFAIQSWLDGSQRKEKVRGILAEIEEKKEEVYTIQQELSSLRDSLNQQLEDGCVDDLFWRGWDRIQVLRDRVIVIEEDSVQAYQQALLYSPDVIDVYRGLITLEYKEYLEAITDGNTRAMTKIGRRIRLYLDMLPRKEQRYWENIRRIDNSPVYRQKIRGLSIERVEPESYLFGCLTEGKRWLSLTGLSGIGKTHLSWTVASRWCKENQIGLVFCDVFSCESFLLFVGALAEALNITHRKVTSADELVDEIQGAGSLLLLIDNAEQLSSESVLFIERLISEAPELIVMTTTRKVLGSSLEHSYRLPFMSFVEGVELFVLYAKQRRIGWELPVEARQSLLNIVEKLDRIPLALRLAAGRISELSILEIERKLQQDTSILAAKENDKEETLYTALQLSCSILSGNEQDLFSQISIFPSHFSLEMVEFVVLWKGDSVLDSIESLVDSNLLLKEVYGNGIRYSMLNSVREYGRGLLDDNLRQTMYHRHALYFSDIFDRYQSKEIPRETLLCCVMDSFSDFMQAATVAPFDVAKDCCLACLMVIERKGNFDLGFEIVEAFLERPDIVDADAVAIYTTWARLHRLAGDIEQAKRIIHRISMLYLYHSDTELEEFSYPIFSIPPLINEDASEEKAAQLLGEGKIWLSTNPSRAVGKLLAAISHYTELKELEKQQEILNQLVALSESEGEYYLALGYAYRLKRIVEQLDEPKKQVEISNKMAVLLTRMGQERQAIGQYNQALSVAKGLKDRENEARIYCNLGILFQARGELKDALTHYQLSRDIFEQLDQKFAIGVLLSNIGTILQLQGDLEGARTSFENAISIAEETKQDLHQAIFQGNLGAIIMELSDFTLAEEYLRKAIEGCALQTSYASGAFKGYLAVLLAKKGSFMAAKMLLDEAEEELVEVKEEYGKFLCRKIEVYFLEHDFEQIKTLVDQVEQLIRELRATESSDLVRNLRGIQNKIPMDVWITRSKYIRIRQEALIYAERAEIHLVQQQHSQAESYFTKAVNMFGILGEKESASIIEEKLVLCSS